jgi:hypothetical protein
MADQRDHVAAHVGHHAAVVYRHLMLSEGLLDQRIHVGRIHVEDEIDLALVLRTPVSPPTADSVAARWLGYFTASASMRLPFVAVASTLPARRRRFVLRHA